MSPQLVDFIADNVHLSIEGLFQTWQEEFTADHSTSQHFPGLSETQVLYGTI